MMPDCPNLAVPATVLQHVVRVESGFHPYAIGVVGGRLARQPRNLTEAVATARMLEQQGYNFSLGLAQVNRYNLRRHGLGSYEQAFTSCDNLRAGSRHVSERSRKDGFLAVRVEHPDDRLQLEQAILDAGALPVYERNREVLAVRFDTLVALAERSGFLQPDTEAVVKALRKLAPASEELADLLEKDVTKLRWEDARNALNSLGAKAVSSTAEGALKSLLKLAFPFL